MNEVSERVCSKVWSESNLVCALGVGALVGALIMTVIVLIVT